MLRLNRNFWSCRVEKVYCSHQEPDFIQHVQVAEPEVNQAVQTGHFGGTSDVGPVHGVYLDNQTDFWSETNFNGLYTQEGVQPNWNFQKSLPDQGVMDFTNWRFSSLSICECPTFEGDSSPMKKRPEPKPIIGFKRSLSSFQEAQYQEKWPRNYEVMPNFPEPVKPVLHLPQLEANRFNQLQTRHWRPGDHLNQSGGIEEVLSYTRAQEISWFNEESLKSNRSYLWQDWTIFRFDHFQPNQLRPEDNKISPRLPEDIIFIQEDIKIQDHLIWKKA